MLICIGDGIRDSLINEKCPALVNLCESLNLETNYNFTPYDVVYFIRHVSIAIGCKNACAHCFSDAPLKVTQTSLPGFCKIINEIGYILKQTNEPLSFFHLGASNDPASIKNYYTYLETWRNAMPDFQTIKVFTHGWMLEEEDQAMEFENFLQVIDKYENIKIVISFNEFSSQARKDWNLYVENVVENLTRIVNVVGKNRIRVEVFYTPHRKICKPHSTLQYWRNRVFLDKSISLNEMIGYCNNSHDPCTNCLKVTTGILDVFLKSQLSASDLIDMTRDCDSIFPGGRGKQFFKKLPKEYIQMGLEIQEQRVLYSLKNYKHKYNGLIINPDGTASLVDYQGFVIGKSINGGKKVISYMSIENT